MAGLFPETNWGVRGVFGWGYNSPDDQMVRWIETASAYDKKMRVPLHRVWTAGVSSMTDPGYRNSHR